MDINTELISLRDDGTNKVQHYCVPYIGSEHYKLGLVNNHYVINTTTNVTSYCLEHYEQVKHISDCHLTCKTSTYYNNDKAGNTYIYISLSLSIYIY